MIMSKFIDLFGIGAIIYDDDHSTLFADEEFIGMGFGLDKEIAKTLIGLPVGTLTYVKSSGPYLCVKSLHVITGEGYHVGPYKGSNKGVYRDTKCLWKASSKDEWIRHTEKDGFGNVRRGTLYVELNESLKRKILSKI
jgi:alpha-glucuronidase